MRKIGRRAVSWLVAAAVTAILSPLSISFAASQRPSNEIIVAKSGGDFTSV